METEIKNLSFDDQGLIPAIVQDANTGKVLTLAYMNEASLNKTIETNETWFYSRSRQALWNKGETSGNKQQIKKISYDCDSDALLVHVDPLGPACHTGEESCFYNDLYTKEQPAADIIERVVGKIKERRNEPQDGSYTTYLFNEGIDKILKKVGEESTEVIIGAKNNDKNELTAEISDLVYHVLVLIEVQGVEIADIKQELVQRHVETDRKNK